MKSPSANQDNINLVAGRTPRFNKLIPWLQLGAGVFILTVVIISVTWISRWFSSRPSVSNPEAALLKQTAIDETQMTNIPPGIYWLDSLLEGVEMETFDIDTFEITNARFADFLNAEGNQREKGALWMASGSSTVRIHKVNGMWKVDENYEDYPVVDVTWYGAKAYCSWRMARLPSEEEWEVAARGGLEKQKYPWGNEEPVCWPEAENGANFDNKDIECPNQVMPVGSYHSNEYGIYDMVGNVWEWTSSPHYSTNKYILRSGSWDMGAYYVDWGMALAPNEIVSYPGAIGFRCARTP